MNTTLEGKKKSVTISPDAPMTIIGEKINPTGRKKMAAALEAENLDYIKELAASQIAAGADVLDINVGVPGLDEVHLMEIVVRFLNESVDIPFCLDSPDARALAVGLSIAPGKPLVNSVSGEASRLEAILPVVKDRGAAVIGLIMDDNGIPATPHERLAVAERIVNRAVQMGIPAEDVIIDPLVMAVGADTQAGKVTLETIRLIRENLGNNINLGASNISHGLPDRPVINMAFMALAIGSGATCAITDPMKLTGFVRAIDLLLGRDDYAANYIKTYRKAQALLASSGG